MGHLRQEKQHLQSTSLQSSQEDLDFHPPKEGKTRDLIYAIVELKDKDLSAADLTGRFPYQSSQGNNYIMIMYHYDCNVILGAPLKDRTASEIVKVFLLP